MKNLGIKIAFSFLGRPYIWGGDDPIKGFDCSGFVIEVLKSVGTLPRNGDWTANDLYRYFFSHRVIYPEKGDLVFYPNKSGYMTHVEICINEKLSIGASGGGSKTKSESDAILQNAYIKIRPFREGPKQFVNPWE